MEKNYGQLQDHRIQGKFMNNEDILLRKSTVNTVLKVAQACSDESRKGWRVKMRQFNDAMDDNDISSKEVRAALEFLQLRMFVIAFFDADGHVTGISLVPQRYPCEFCNMVLHIQDAPEKHIDVCLRRQKKIERNRALLK
jgi:hypothetical protein